MKRIVFLDYVRVFACFLVIVVHASENFYGAAGSTDMAGPQSFLANESDRLWVSIYDGFSRMAVPLFIIVSAFLLTPMKEELTSWQFYRQRCIRILPPVSSVHGVIQYPAPAVGTNRCRNIGKGFISNTTQLPDTGRTPVVYVSPDQPLFIIPVISPWLKKATAKEERFFIGLFLLSTCMPYLNRWWGRSLGDNVSGTNSTCCSISPASSVTWSWHIICTPTSPGAAPNASEQESL